MELTRDTCQRIVAAKMGPQMFRNMMLMRKQKAKEQPKAFIPHCFIHQLIEKK